MSDTDPKLDLAVRLMTADWKLLADAAAFSEAFADEWGSDGIEFGPLFAEARRIVVTDQAGTRDKIAAKLLATAEIGDLAEIVRASTELRHITRYHEISDMATGQVQQAFDKEQQGWLDALSEPEADLSEMEAELAEMAGLATETTTAAATK